MSWRGSLPMSPIRHFPRFSKHSFAKKKFSPFICRQISLKLKLPMRVISKAGEYGLRALLYMVSKRADVEFVNIRGMSEELDISFHFLTKILQSLTQKGLLRSYRGPNGGIGFQIPPEEILLSDLIRALEGDDFFEKCLLGLPGCGEKKPCPMHDFWKETKGKLQAEFESTTLAELGQSTRQNRFRLMP